MDLEHLEKVIDARDCIGLFRVLGFEVDPVEIDLSDWRRCGFDPGLREPARLIHAARSGHLELLCVEDGSDPRAVIARYRSFNKRIRPLIAATSDGSMRLWTWASGKSRALELVHGSTSPDILSRIASISNRAHDRNLEARIERAFGPADLEAQFLERFRKFWKSGAAEIREQTSCSPDEARAQSLLVLSRLLFLSYVQLKGWLDGNPRYLFERARETVELGEDPYSSFIAPLFFRCLNTPAAKRRGRASRMGRIPYLNGGLFARSPLEKNHPRLRLSPDLVLGAIEECFERFAFTVSEDDENRVAIDPEMLGRVFESLMDEDERGRTGSFYTPRAIVDEIVTSTLASWLASGDPGLERVLLEDPGRLSARRARDLFSRLREVRVLDPACGSGAFLMAALRAIESTSAALGSVIRRKAFSRRTIVERSLHGVDLKPEAVTLCELRLWLAIVASDPARRVSSVRPLPQLDRNILQGNSLLSELDAFAADSSSSSDWVRLRKRHADLVDSYRVSSGKDRARCKRLLSASDQSLARTVAGESVDRSRAALERIRSQQKTMFGADVAASGIEQQAREHLRHCREVLRRVERNELDFFSWNVDFAHLDSTFDVIVGNPPWIRGSRLTATDRRLLSARYQFARGGGRGVRQFDVATLFVEKGLDLLDGQGRLSMLLPSKVLSSDHSSTFRRVVTSRHSLLSIRDYSRKSGLFDADTFPVAITLGLEPKPGRPVEVNRPGEAGFSIDVDDSGSPWRLVRRDVIRVVEDLFDRYPPLERVLGRRPLMGVKTGANRNFFVEVARLDGPWAELAEGVRIPLDRLARCARGRDLERWRCEPSTWMIWPPSLAPGDQEWLEPFLRTRRIRLEDLNLPYLVPAHLETKVAWKDLSAGMKAALLPPRMASHGSVFPLVPNQTLYMIEVASSEEGYAISGFLNSSIGNVLASLTADQAKDGHRRYFARTVAGIPMFEPRLDDPTVRDVIRLARAAEAGHAPHSSELDRAVARCLGLTSRTLGLIEAATHELGL